VIVARRPWSESTRAWLGVVDDILTENRHQLERLLDLYLAGDFPREVLTDRKSCLETTIRSLERERTGLVAHLEAENLAEGQIQTLLRRPSAIDGDGSTGDEA
jgi:hypothetical protein